MVLGKARWFDLLRSTELLKLMRSTDQFRFEVEALEKGSWIVVDEYFRLWWRIVLLEDSQSDRD
ncbi:MAG: hypothetical protein BROFUL_01944 [Candidatus Brocadia fulgida]|uniref:Uncharacterized protein n=1 Tax=Candidatus Brocadia fulgida TaxID=380242 RepID=A0A0M2UUP8_9BACT|nr:MAG: hypothetical protein BROFUL_01944 [Candidatus Brocadia fulgida]